MDQNFHEEEDIMMDIDQTNNDDFDASLFLMVVMVAIGAQFQNSRKRIMGQHFIERPLRRPVTNLGEKYIQKYSERESWFTRHEIHICRRDACNFHAYCWAKFTILLSKGYI
ncbi:hypothetical protein F2Q70_00007784 [Brassica cretica]|uniref:Uncharacterized protein n=1 Tax=Brassica cretica TaxID=69181 RepID=A0A8S9LVS1_BRACR|nr:hypothetical protein F2Q70_00007784 [Brassica cretica]